MRILVFCGSKFGATIGTILDAIQHVDYLMYSGYITMAYFWAMLAQQANEKIAEKPDNIEYS
jgi:hypothetical protein